MSQGPQGIIDRIIDLLDDYGPQIPSQIPSAAQGSVNVITQELQVAAAELKEPPAPQTAVPGPTLSEYQVEAATYDAIESVLSVPSPVSVSGVTYGTPVDIPPPQATDTPSPPSENPTIPYDAAYLDAVLEGEFELPEVGARPENVDIGGEKYLPIAPTLPPNTTPVEPNLEPYVPPEIELGNIDAPPVLVGRSYTEQEQDTMAAALIDKTLRQEFTAINGAINDGASRNFFAPTPMMNAAILAAGEKARLQREEANLSVTKEAYAADLQTNQALISAGIDINKAYVKWYVSGINDLVRLQKFNLQMLDALSKSAMDLFNAKVGLAKEYYGAARVYIRAVDEQNSASAAYASIGEAKLNQVTAEVNSFSAQHNTRSTAAGVLDTQQQTKSLPFERLQNDLPLVDANIQVGRQNLDGLTAALDAYRRYYEADVERFRSVSEGNQALSSITQVDSANAALYAKQLRAETGRGDAFLQYKQGQVQELEAAISQYREYVQAHRGQITSLQQQVSAEAQKVRAYTQALGSKAGYLTEWNKASISRVSAINSLAASAAETSSRSQALDAQAMAAEARIEAGRLSAEGITAAGFATAALGITSGTARMTGVASVGDGTQDSYSENFAETGTRSYSSSRTVKKESE